MTVRRTRARAAAIGAVIGTGALLLAGCGQGADEGKNAAAPSASAPAAAPASGGPAGATASQPPLAPGQVRVAGDVAKPYTLTLADLRKLPQTSAAVKFTSAKGEQEHTYQGVLLDDD
ncbi:hypothetical protein AB0P15_00860 [Streptomyces sp. NPDC087917]|uniref:hypothetical protein n=1 Tax=unclassified Streptomyces TaxID=2593676 RepID=UPI00341FBD3E